MTKKPFYLTLFMLVSTCFFATTAFAQESDKVKIKTSAVCGMCKSTIEKSLIKVEGVSYVNLDVTSKVATIKFDPAVVNEDALRTALTMVGYDADGILANDKAYENLHDCCKKDVAH